MKTKAGRLIGIFAIIAAAAAVSLLAGCAPAGQSISDVLKDFTAAVNARDAGGVKECLDSDATSYSTAATSAWFSQYFPEMDYAASISVSGKTARVVFNSTSGTDQDYTFEMSEEKGTMFEGGTYHIRRIRNTASTSDFFE